MSLALQLTPVPADHRSTPPGGGDLGGHTRSPAGTIYGKYLRTTPITPVSIWKLPLLSPIYPKGVIYLPTTPVGVVGR